MRTRQFAGTDVNLSEVGFGCWGIGKTWWGETEDSESKRALDSAAGSGVNFFDTAFVYGDGHSEQLVGAMVRRFRDKKIYVASKIPPLNHEWPAKHETPLKDAFPKEHVRKFTEKSLKNLGLETIFLQQLHVFSPNWVHENDWAEEFEKLRDEGKILHWGVSINDHQPETGLELIRQKMVHSLQVIYNIFDQSPEDELLDLAHKEKVAVLARVPLDEGGLTGNFTDETTFGEGDFRGEYFAGDRLKETVKRVADIKNDLPADTPVWKAALQYTLNHPGVTSVIPGMRKKENLKKNISVGIDDPMSDELAETLKNHRWDRNFYL